MQLGIHKSEGKSPYLYPAKRITPDKSITTTRRDRKVELLHSSIEEMIIPKVSNTGKQILTLWQHHQDFGSLYRDDIAPESEIEF